MLIPTLPDAGAFVNFASGGSDTYIVDKLRFSFTAELLALCARRA
jgi:hypothetical protein